MRDANYGFAAIDHRFKVLGGTPIVIDDGYGPGYTGHPRLATLMAQNRITPLNFFTGEEEAQAFENKNFVGLHQSTLSKVDVVSNLFQRTYDRQLKTLTTWKEMHGGTIKGILNWIADNKMVALLLALLGLAVGILGWHPWGK